MEADSRDTSKATKKALKAEAKLAKKLAKNRAATDPSVLSPQAAQRGKGENDLSPTERSARAAERQVRLQRLRVIFAALMFIVAVVTLLLTTRPWENKDSGDNAPRNTINSTKSEHDEIDSSAP